MHTGIDQLLDTVTRVANTLRSEEIPFAVAGGCAVYARGGPASDQDVDIFIKPADAQRARQALVRAGLRAADPPEDWLTTVYDGDTLVDLVFQPNHRAVTDALLARASTLPIGPTVAPVISATDLVIDKLMVLDSHRLDFTGLLRTARELREQVDWPRVAEETGASPYARAFLGLLDDLHISRDDDPATDDLLPQYLAANLRRVLAEDPRTAELGVQVSVRDNAVALGGEVSSTRRRLHIEEVVREQAPKLQVHNDVRVITPDGPVGRERLG
ncbi:BON domain-containing protein [Nocardia miyunensis]|uniref:BON domain-containing protein n=1 Tax=Nocardia miyunensis TaxID=282684 RepID=UPI000829B639|nr:BON domain-containing protein [Nocardia miyunensis]